MNLTGQAENARVTRLENSDVIHNYTIDVNHKKLDYNIRAFINVYMHKISHKPFFDFLGNEQEYVLETHKVVGDGCYLLECRFPDQEDLSLFLERLNVHANYKVSTVL